MAEVKEIHINAEVEKITDTETSDDNDSNDNKEKTLVERMRDIAETALDTVKSEVKKEIEDRIAPVEETAANLTSEVKAEVEAIVQRVREQYEAEREDLLHTENRKRGRNCCTTGP